MILIRSPTLTFAFLFSVVSITLTILTVTIQHEQFTNPLRTLIICPPLNCLFVFLFSATWTERRFRLSYIPFISLLILFGLSLTLAIISGVSLSVSVVVYLNLIYYCLCSLLFLSVIITILICYGYGSLFIHRYRNMMTTEQQSAVPAQDTEPLKVDQVQFRSSTGHELTLFMSKLPGRRIRHDIRSIKDDLEQIQVHTIITLNEIKELSFMNMTKKNLYSMDIYAMHIKRANIEHLIYSVRDRFIPKSISDYIQFLYSMVMNVRNTNRNRILVHCMGGMGRTGMTVVCLDLMFEHLMTSEGEPERAQTFVERVCHYPLLLTSSCRVCQSIGNVRQARPGAIHNPLQIIFAHEFYGRLKSGSYMRDIKHILQHNENLLSNNQDDFYTSTNNHLSIWEESRINEARKRECQASSTNTQIVWFHLGDLSEKISLLSMTPDSFLLLLLLLLRLAASLSENKMNAVRCSSVFSRVSKEEIRDGQQCVRLSLPNQRCNRIANSYGRMCIRPFLLLCKTVIFISTSNTNAHWQDTTCNCHDWH